MWAVPELMLVGIVICLAGMAREGGVDSNRGLWQLPGLARNSPHSGTPLDRRPHEWGRCTLECVRHEVGDFRPSGRVSDAEHYVAKWDSAEFSVAPGLSVTSRSD